MRFAPGEEKPNEQGLGDHGKDKHQSQVERLGIVEPLPQHQHLPVVQAGKGGALAYLRCARPHDVTRQARVQVQAHERLDVAAASEREALSKEPTQGLGIERWAPHDHDADTPLRAPCQPFGVRDRAVEDKHVGIFGRRDQFQVVSQLEGLTNRPRRAGIKDAKRARRRLRSVTHQAQQGKDRDEQTPHRGRLLDRTGVCARISRSAQGVNVAGFPVSNTV